MKRVIMELFRLMPRTLTTIMVLLLVNVLFYSIGVVYLEPALNSNRLAFNNLREKMSIIGRTDVSATYRQGKKDLEKLMVMIPAKRDFPKVLGDIADDALSSGVVLGGFNYKHRIVKDENLMVYNVTISVSGRYAAIKSFLDDMQNIPDLTVIEDISMANSDPYEENLTMELRLAVYLRESK